MSEKLPRYGVQAAMFEREIYAGQLSKEGHTFIDRHEVTTDVFRAMADYVIHHMNGETTMSFDGVFMQVKVWEAYEAKE